MDNESRDGEHASKDVTVVISRKIKLGCENQYDEWFKRYLMLERRVPGYVGTTIITQGGTDSAIRHIIHRFSDKASLDAWENSQQSFELIEEANKCSTRYYSIIYSHTGPRVVLQRSQVCEVCDVSSCIFLVDIHTKTSFAAYSSLVCVLKLNCLPWTNVSTGAVISSIILVWDTSKYKLVIEITY
jgi:hypothetical protein